jgi:hypothetical protein
VGLRRHIDASGKSWNVWDVPPRFSNKRSNEERRNTPGHHEPERRHLGERRVTTAPPEWVHGWICFEDADEKRRLCPMPEEWETASDQQLEQYLREAVQVLPRAGK